MEVSSMKLATKDIPQEPTESEEQHKYWKAIMKEHEKSGSTIKDFCNKKNLNYSRFRNWRFRVSKKNNKIIVAKPNNPQQKFIPIAINDVPDTKSIAMDDHNIELKFCHDSIYINIPSNFDYEAISNLLTIIGKIR